MNRSLYVRGRGCFANIYRLTVRTTTERGYGAFAAVILHNAIRWELEWDGRGAGRNCA